MAIDTSWANVSLLCPFDTDLLDIKGHAITASGGAALSSAVGTPFGAGSALYCNSISKYLSSSSADFAFGSGSYTAEMWIYAPLSHSGNMGLFATSPQAASPTGVLLTLSPTGVLRISETWNTNTIASSAGAVSANTWTHVAVIRSGTTTVIKVNGTQVATGTHSGNYTSTAFVIGGDYTTPFVACLCYFSDVRITKGVARTITAAPSARFPRPTISGHVYDAAAAPVAKTVLVRDRSTGLYLGGANSDPSTGAYTFYPPDFGEVIVERIDELADPYWTNVLFASRLNAAGFPTLTGQTLTVTGTVTDSAATDPFGGSQKSALFNGATSYLTASGSSLLGTTHTVKGWFKTTSLGSPQGIFFVGTYGSDNNRTELYVPVTGDISYYAQGTGVVFNLTAAAGTCVTNTWYYFEAVRYGTEVALFINGALVASGTASGTESTGATLYLGYARTASANRGLDGRLFEVQIANRVEHVSAYTAPTTPFLVGPADAGSGENALIYDRVIPGG
ncbi:MAG: LamG domain-containing protein [Candidatus Accumulibacter propinquus]|jgi:hypothetical protein